MIEINLSPSKREGQGQLQELMDKINLKMMLIALLIFFVPEALYLTMADEEISGIQEQVAAVNAEIQSMNNKLNELKKIEEQIKALKDLEGKLAGKLEIVRSIINKRQNPFYILQYIANNTPGDLWVTDLELQGSQIEVKGFSDSWKSIGVLLENLKSSIFFDKSIQYEQPKNNDPKYDEWKRKENFVITSSIVRFE